MRYIENKVTMRVRFSEVDAMGVVWHGNYLKYFEDGRETLGEKLGMSYMDIANEGYVIPIINVQVDFKAPATFGEPVEITCRLIESQAAKIVHEYEVKNLKTGKLCCTGTTQQVFLEDSTRELELVFPDFYIKWKNQLSWIEK